MDLSLEIHNIGRFFLSEKQQMSTFFSTSCWVSSHHQHVETGNDSHICICSRLVTTTHGMMSIVTQCFFILPAIDKDFGASVARLAFRLHKLFRQSVPSLSVLKSMLALGENFLRLSTSSHVVLTVSRGTRV